MVIKEKIYEICKECGRSGKLLQDTQYGCDWCKKIIDFEDNKYGHKTCPHLQLTVFYLNKSEEHTEGLAFCSWKCIFSYLLTLKDRTDIDFISLPSDKR